MMSIAGIVTMAMVLKTMFWCVTREKEKEKEKEKRNTLVGLLYFRATVTL